MMHHCMQWRELPARVLWVDMGAWLSISQPVLSAWTTQTGDRGNLCAVSDDITLPFLSWFELHKYACHGFLFGCSTARLSVLFVVFSLFQVTAAVHRDHCGRWPFGLGWSASAMLSSGAMWQILAAVNSRELWHELSEWMVLPEVSR